MECLVQVPPRGQAQQSGKKVQCYEPATMKYLGYVPALTPTEVRESLHFSHGQMHMSYYNESF